MFTLLIAIFAFLSYQQAKISPLKYPNAHIRYIHFQTFKPWMPSARLMPFNTSYARAQDVSRYEICSDPETISK